MMTPEDFDNALAQAAAGGTAALATIDVDEFKQVNDDFGKDAGDAVLRALEKALVSNVPDGGSVCRVGGDEYLVLFPDATPEEALIHLEEIRALFSSRPPAPSVPRPVNISVGIAGMPAQARDAATLRTRSGDALHRAKLSERSRTAIYVEEKMVLKSSYYSRRSLAELAKLSERTSRTEASLLREALDDLLVKHSANL